jgi:hypothetical protein
MANKNRHGMSGTRFYHVWDNIKARCNNPHNISYKNYGGRGISYLWTSCDEFKNDMYESYLKHVDEFGEKQTTIERIDNDSDYCKENCRWATMKEQSLNKRPSNRIYPPKKIPTPKVYIPKELKKINTKTPIYGIKSKGDYYKYLGISRQAYHVRIKCGWITDSKGNMYKI